MDTLKEKSELKTGQESSLTPVQLKIIKMARAADQIYYGQWYIEPKPSEKATGLGEQAEELRKEMHKLTKENQISIANTGLIGFDEQLGRFDMGGHTIQEERRKRQGRAAIFRGRGHKTTFKDQKAGEWVSVYMFDSPDDEDFIRNHREMLNEWMNTNKDKRVVIIVGDKEI